MTNPAIDIILPTLKDIQEKQGDVSLPDIALSVLKLTKPKLALLKDYDIPVIADKTIISRGIRPVFEGTR